MQISFCFLAECDGTGEPNIEPQVRRHNLVIIIIVLHILLTHFFRCEFFKFSDLLLKRDFYGTVYRMG